jgi:methionine-rich copper-binding protein CopC
MTRYRSLFVQVIAAIFFVAGAAVLSAHMKLEKSEPAEGATVTAPPSSVQLFFNEAPDLKVSKLTLVGPTDKATLVGTHAMGKSLMATVQGELADGPYTVQWQGAGDDGHVQKGEVKFVLKRAK